MFSLFQYHINIEEDSACILAFSVLCKTAMKSKPVRKERNTPFLMDCSSQLFSIGDFEESVFTNNN